MRFLVPLRERIGARLELSEKAVTVPMQTVQLAGHNTVQVGCAVFYRVTAPQKAARVDDSLGVDIERTAKPLVRNAFEFVAPDTLNAKLELLNQELRLRIDEIVTEWGIEITRVELVPSGYSGSAAFGPH